MPPIIFFQVADVLAILGVVVFVSYYTFLAPWWREAFGLTLVLKDVMLGAMLTLVGLNLFLGLSRITSEALAWVQLALLTGVGLTLFWRTVVFGQMAVREGRDWAPGWLRRKLPRKKGKS